MGKPQGAVRSRGVELIKTTALGPGGKPGQRVNIAVDNNVNNATGVAFYLGKIHPLTNQPCFMLPEQYERLTDEHKQSMLVLPSEVSGDDQKAKAEAKMLSATLAASQAQTAALAAQVEQLTRQLGQQLGQQKAGGK